MRGKPPIVRDCMTHLPVEGDRCETVADAARLMETHHVRHLPVMSGSHLNGIVSQRDILSARLRHGDAAEAMLLEEICTKDVLRVGPLTPVNQVASQMLGTSIRGQTSIRDVNKGSFYFYRGRQ